MKRISKIKKYITLFGVLTLGIVSCENDDFCSEPTTPRLIISLLDSEFPEEYKDAPLFVWAEAKDSIYNLATVDSIYVPLNTAANSVTYILSNVKVLDTFKFDYDIEDIFVSESCGYKSIFKNLTISSSTQNWIKSIEVSNANIENENEAHVKIFH